MTFGEFRFGVNKEGSYRLEVPISSEFSAIDSDFSSSDEELSSPRFINTKASGKLAKIFSDTSFESSADSFISSDSDSVDSFNFIDKSAAIGKLHLPKELQGKIVHDPRQQCKIHQEQVEQGIQRLKQGWIERDKKEGNIGSHQKLPMKICAGSVLYETIPHSIVTENGSNFTSKEFKAYCAEVGIKLSFASVAHPQTNGQVEKANGIICNGIKKRLLGSTYLARRVAKCVMEYPNNTKHGDAGDAVLSVHGAEAVLPIEIEHDSPRVTEYDEETSRRALEDDVDALDEARGEVLSRVAKYRKI
ncbi:hypothetical protein QYE76_042057 [Lolium multiflorum]|uniref:Integrase catalytic domain-containing protein n=1 Tax=Lolium multiflorum TaxID=4521 RepID=A0AAD8TG76_LOLMU|nr:hypothetical protein QYE76_042057 [Lolium multiflorum]